MPERDLLPSLHKQLAHLSRHYRIITLTEAVQRLRNGEPVPRRALCVTIDDGYRDFRSHAWDVFKKYSIPATIYVVPGFIQRTQWMWWDKVEHIFLHLRSNDVSVVTPDKRKLNYRASSVPERIKSARHFCADALRWHSADRDQMIEQLSNLHTKSPLPAHPPEEYSALTWDDLRLLDRNGVEFGSHTYTHPILSTLQNESDRERELVSSKSRIEAELGHSISHFCFPNGGHGDYSTADLHWIRSAGYASAVTLHAGLNMSGSDPFRLRRINVGPDLPEEFFRAKVAQLWRVTQWKHVNKPLAPAGVLPSQANPEPLKARTHSTGY